ncbi:MAG: hypothetical protein R3176_01005 [Woeseiaceae bacterium]|nr:hypothetical protein [Woeseiaceae bacterium]
MERTDMDIVYAAEKSSIADLLSATLEDEVTEGDIEVSENPAETGSFLVRWRLNRYMLAPNGEVIAIRRALRG